MIVEQCERHVLKLPAFEGIAIDRLDYSEYFNYDADDNVSWVPTSWLHGSSKATGWGPARALRLSYANLVPLPWALCTIIACKVCIACKV